jgi:hypothetical protein
MWLQMLWHCCQHGLLLVPLQLLTLPDHGAQAASHA